jgi:hypothetical protein
MEKEDKPESLPLKDISMSHQSLYWYVNNPYYSLKLSRHGGVIKEMKDKKSGKIIVSNQDIQTQKGFSNRTPFGCAQLDHSTGARYYIENGKLKLRFLCWLSPKKIRGFLEMPVWAVTDYTIDSGDAMKMDWYIWCEGYPIKDGATLEWLAEVNGKEMRIPLIKNGTPSEIRTWLPFGAEISSDSFKIVKAPPMPEIQYAKYRLWQMYSLSSKKYTPLMIGSLYPGSWFSVYTQVNARYVKGHTSPAAFKLMMPVNLAKIIAPVKVKPGNYRLATWIKAEKYSNLQDKPNKLKLRLSWISADGKTLIKERRMPIPEGTYDWKAFEFKVKVPEGAKELTILQSCWKFYGKGTLFVEFPQLVPDN